MTLHRVHDMTSEYTSKATWSPYSHTYSRQKPEIAQYFCM